MAPLQQALSVVTLVAVACGSTVQGAGSGESLGTAEEIASELGGDLSAEDLPPGARVNRKGQIVSASGEVIGTTKDLGTASGGTASGTATPGGTSSGGTAGGSRPAGPTSGAGFDARHVYIGVPTQNDLNKTADDLGVQGFATGDMEADARAMADYINRNGGILGREVEVVFKDNRTAELLADGHRVAQENCTYFTEDRPVVAVVNMVGLMMDELADCLASRQTVMVRTGNFYDETVEEDHHPYLYAMLSAKSESWLPILLDRLHARKYFSRWDTATGQPGQLPVKVGLFYNDWPITNRSFALLQDLLEERGIEVAATYAYGDRPEDAKSAQLRFAAAGVTHVFTDYGFATLQFMQNAESQNYRPRYALHTFQAPTLLEQNAPRGQMRGALGVGFSSHQDVTAQQYSGEAGPASAQCRKIFANAGLRYARQSSEEMFAFAFCDSFRLLADGINAGNSFAAMDLRQSVGQIGPNFASATSFTTGLSQERTDAVGAVRDLGWVDGCSCLRYLSSKMYKV